MFSVAAFIIDKIVYVAGSKRLFSIKILKLTHVMIACSLCEKPTNSQRNCMAVEALFVDFQAVGLDVRVWRQISCHIIEISRTITSCRVCF